MPKKIIIVRHGETDYNKQRRFQGWLNIPLNKVGHEQAKLVAQKLKEEKIDALYSSDLTRTIETATHIAEAIGKKIIQAEALRENNMGVFQGWQWEVEKDEIKQRLWEGYQNAQKTGDILWKLHEGESIAEHGKRIGDFLGVIHEKHPEQIVVLVTHGGTINRILEYYQVKKVGEAFQSHNNGSLIVLTKKANGYELVMTGEHE